MNKNRKKNQKISLHMEVENLESCTLPEGLENEVTTRNKNVVVPWKIKNVTTMGFPNPSLEQMPTELTARLPSNKYLYIHYSHSQQV